LAPHESEDEVDKRRLGKTGERLSVVGFGGIVVMDVTPEEASQYVTAAIDDRGVNYFDVAPTYGNAEERLGPALEPYRDDVFLACKTGKRTADEAEAELHQSLERLRTDHFDLYQLHAVKTDEDVETILGPSGALETFVKAREQGLVRYLGFSAHSEEAALALIDAFDFDTILFPTNWVCWLNAGFGPRVIEAASARDMGILALKTLAKRRWREGEQRHWSKTWYSPVDTFEEARDAFRFTFSRPVTAGTSPGHFELFNWMCDAADQYVPLTPELELELSEKAADLEPIFPQD
jgi:aryl-alcohol dehydrogenase-like predicted oxidoreductase